MGLSALLCVLARGWSGRLCVPGAPDAALSATARPTSAAEGAGVKLPRPGNNARRHRMESTKERRFNGAGPGDASSVPPALTSEVNPAVERERAPANQTPDVQPPSRDGALGSLTGYSRNSQKQGTPAPEPQADNDRPRDADRFLIAAEREITPRDENRQLSLAKRYELRTKTRDKSLVARIRKCGTRIYDDPTICTRELGNGDRTAHWCGVIQCQRAGCPWCGGKKADKFGKQALRVLNQAGTVEGGRQIVQHVISTVPHLLSDPLEVVYDRLLDGVAALSKHRLMQRVTFTMRAAEFTWGPEYGWHAHAHSVWGLDPEWWRKYAMRLELAYPGAMSRFERGPKRPPLLKAEKQLLSKVWAENTGADLEHGLKFGAAFDCRFEWGRERAARYISKLGHELRGTGKKTKNFSLAEIFERAAKGDPLFVRLMREYQQATTGRRLYQIDKRAKKLHDASEPLPEEIILKEWVTVVDRAEFSGLSRIERFGRDRLAVYWPIDAAATARGDPAVDIQQTIDSLLRAFDADVRPAA